MSNEIDYEGELAIVIGKKCKNVEIDESNNYIFGYTVLNDVTARDVQRYDEQWTRGKSFDTFAPIGPVIETNLNPQNQKIKTTILKENKDETTDERKNQNLIKEIRQDSNTSNMVFSSYELVSFISKVMTLNPGDVIATGTPPGVGQVKVGEIVEVEIEDIEYILEEASKLEKVAKSEERSEELAGKILGLMFFEPSTRTRLSFETAMKRLSGRCISLGDTARSSVAKGESIADTAKMIEGYSDAIVIRHDVEGVSKFLTDIVDIPVINAGDGAGQHPTQTLLDLYTIKKHFGRIDGLNIALLGDLKYGRTVHSLSYGLGYYDVKMTFVSPDELKMPEETLHDLEENNIPYTETSNLKDVIDDVDVLYVTRIQKERFPDIDEYEKIKGAYLIIIT